MSRPSGSTIFLPGQGGLKVSGRNQPKEAVSIPGHFRFSRELKTKNVRQGVKRLLVHQRKKVCVACEYQAQQIILRDRCCRLAIRRIGNFQNWGA